MSSGNLKIVRRFLTNDAIKYDEYRQLMSIFIKKVDTFWFNEHGSIVNNVIILRENRNIRL